MTTTQEIFSIIAIALVTFMTRVIPFCLFRSNKPTPKYIEYLGNVLPFSIIGMLLVYCLKSVDITSFPFGLAEGIAIILVIIIHKWKHNLLLSVGGGTIIYMVLVQTIFNV